MPLPVRRTYQACNSGLVEESRKYGSPMVARQQHQNAQRGIARLRRLPTTARAESAAARNSPAAAPRATSICVFGFRQRISEVRIGVSGQQHQLEKQHRRAPHRGRSAEPRQNDLGDQRLHLKQQKGAQENGDGVEESLLRI